MANNPVTEKGLKAAGRLAKRKTGVTRGQLAKELKITVARAATILARVGARARALGEDGGKACRTLVYKT